MINSYRPSSGNLAGFALPPEGLPLIPNQMVMTSTSTPVDSLVNGPISSNRNVTKDEIDILRLAKWADGTDIFPSHLFPFGSDSSEIESTQELAYESLAMICAPLTDGSILGAMGVSQLLRDATSEIRIEEGEIGRKVDKINGIIFSTSFFDDERQLYIAEVDRSNAKFDVANSNKPCIKCNHLTVQYVVAQKRAADEPATVNYTCRNPLCGKKWKA